MISGAVTLDTKQVIAWMFRIPYRHIYPVSEAADLRIECQATRCEGMVYGFLKWRFEPFLR
jgi:hypothetical protein